MATTQTSEAQQTQAVTYVGVQVLVGIAMLLGNRAGSTIAVIAYDDEDPPAIIDRDWDLAALRDLRAMCLTGPSSQAFLTLAQIRRAA